MVYKIIPQDLEPVLEILPLSVSFGAKVEDGLLLNLYESDVDVRVPTIDKTARADATFIFFEFFISFFWTIFATLITQF